MFYLGGNLAVEHSGDSTLSGGAKVNLSGVTTAMGYVFVHIDIDDDDDQDDQDTPDPDDENNNGIPDDEETDSDDDGIPDDQDPDDDNDGIPDDQDPDDDNDGVPDDEDPDDGPTNDEDDDDVDVFTPIDPNQKTTWKGYGPGGHVLPDTEMSYTVEFENLPEASAAALKVDVRDALDANLDWTTFVLDEIAFGETVIDAPDGLNHYTGRVQVNGWTWNQADGWHQYDSLGNPVMPLVVDVDAGIDISTGEVFCTLECADLSTGYYPNDVFAGFLPPDQDSIAFPDPLNTNRMIHPGEGHISFSVTPVPNLPTGTEIRNEASIVFDWNAPIVTNEVLNTIDAAGPTSQVDPLPAQVPTTDCTVSWSGHDDATGSGIASYDIYVSDNAGPYTLWLDDTTATSGDFAGAAGHTYSFYSIAIDLVGHAESAPETADAEIQVLGDNQPPVASDDTYNVNEDNSLVVEAPGVLDNDEDIDGDPLTAVLDVGVSHGTLVLNADGSFTYTPYNDYDSADTFTYHANDSDLHSNEATVTITIHPVNDAPVTTDDDKAATEDTPLSFDSVDLTANDSAGPANESTQTLGVIAVSPTSARGGTVLLNGADTITYTPPADYYGADSFTYTVTDDGTTGGLPDPKTATGTVNVEVAEVNDSPVANDDSFSTVEDTPLSINSVDLLSNDLAGPANESGQKLTVTAVSSPSIQGGTVVLNGGRITYTPPLDYSGPDNFSYTMTDDGTTAGLPDLKSATATVNVDVSAVADAPVLYAYDVSGDEGTPIPLNITASLSDTDGSESLAIVISGVPANATLSAGTDSGDGTWTILPGQLPGLSITVADNTVLVLDITATSTEASNGDTASNSAAMTLTVNNVAPTVDGGSDQTVNEGDIVSFSGWFTDPGSADTHTIAWDFGDGTTAAGTLTPTHVYADNGVYTVALTVTDDDGASTSDTLAVTVNNVAPNVETIFVDVEIAMQISGEKGNSVELVIEQDGDESGRLELVRTTGAPNEGSVPVSIDLSKDYTATLYFESENNKGATPVWLGVDDHVVKITTFNAQKNKPDTWSQELEIDLDPVIFAPGVDLNFRATASDPGSDDLTFTWDFGDGSEPIESTYYNDGLGPDPDLSPDGTYPFSATDEQTHAYSGDESGTITYTLILTVEDDDDGLVVLTYDLTIHL
jgi:VCBS repeat-containing protein